MNAKLSSVAIALIATSAAAFGADLSIPSRSRDDVRAELEQAYASGELARRTEYVEHTGTPSGVSRAAVKAEQARTAAARPADGTAEFVEHTHVTGGKTRAEVRAELEQAYADGTLHGEPEYVEHVNVASGKSRDQAGQEAIRAAKAKREILTQSGS